jgi:hypothetical protein
VACGLGDGAPGAQRCDDLAEAGALDFENRGESAPDRGKLVLSAGLLKARRMRRGCCRYRRVDTLVADRDALFLGN